MASDSILYSLQHTITQMHLNVLVLIVQLLTFFSQITLMHIIVVIVHIICKSWHVM